MKVLLVRPAPPNKLSFTNILNAEPIELEYLHTGLMKAGYQDYIYDYICESKPFDRVLRDYEPDVVAISGYITQENVMKNLCGKAKAYKPQIRTIIGGVHAQLNHERIFDERVDFIMRSESIDAFVRLIKAIDRGLDSNENLDKINGLCFKDSSAQWQVNALERINIDSLPIPDRSFFNENKHNFRYLELNEIASIKTSFSCPYSCNFCYCTLLNAGKYQARDINLVIEELKTIEAVNVQITDDDFLVDVERLKTFISMVRANNIKKTFVCYARADFVANNPEIARELADIGFKYFLVGLEALNDSVLENYNKGTSLEHNSQAVKVIREAGAECIALMIMGLQAEKQDFENLYNWVVKNEINHVTISVFTPIPGTPLYEEYKDRLVDTQIEHWDFLHLVVAPEKLSKRQFYRYYRRLFIKLYKRAKKAGLYEFLDLKYYKEMLSRYLLRKMYLDR